MGYGSVEKITELFETMGGEAKAAFASDLAHDYAAGWLDDKKRKLAVEIFRVLCLDAEIQVKRILAERLQKDHSIPKDIATKLASEVSEISVPMLKYSPLLEDSELLTIVNQTTELAKIEAIASRKIVPEKMALAIVDRKHLPAVELLAANKGAEITDSVILNTAVRFKENGSLLAKMLNRNSHMSPIADKVLGIVSASVRSEIMKKCNISPFKLQREMLASREAATLAILTPGRMDQALDMVSSLSHGHRLTNTIIIRSLYIGAVEFFVAALARRADVTYESAQELLSSSRGFRAIYLAAKMPAAISDEVYVAYNCARNEAAAAKKERRDFSAIKMLDAVNRQGVNMEVDNMHFLLGMVDHGQIKEERISQ